MATVDAPVIEVRNLNTCIGDSCIHRTIDLDVWPGEVMAIVGGSGAGKTLLLHEIVMLHQPTGGSIRLFGREVVGIDASAANALRRRFGMLFQQGALFGSLTVLQNVEVPLREHTDLPRTLIRELAGVKLALVGFPPDGVAKYPREISGGMLKRAAMARAIALDPQLLFLDEPTAGLDPVSADAIDELVIQLRSSLGLTVLMVTHDLDSLWRVADRAVFLADERIVALGTPGELVQDPHPRVAAYFRGRRGRRAQERAWSPE